MKRIALCLSSTIALLTLGALAASASAPDKFRIDVPFNFTAGKTPLPAGKYTIVWDRMPNMIQLTDQSGRIWAALNVSEQTRTSTAEKSSVFFYHHGDHYFLSSVKRRGDDRTYAPRMIDMGQETVSSAK